MNDSCFKIDWLSFTWKGKHSDFLSQVQNVEPWCYDLLSTLDNFFYFFPELKEALNNQDVSLSDKGGGFYSSVYIFSSSCRIYFNLDSVLGSTGLIHDVGVNVQIPSHALEWFYDLMGIEDNDICGLMRLLADRNCQLSRIDLCFDDYGMKYYPRDYYRFWDNDQIRSKYFKFASYISTTQKKGHTIYFGKRHSGRLLRIYDKDYESKGDIKSIRYEFELHADYAKGAQLYFLEHNTIDFWSYLSNYFQVIDRSTDSNKSRCDLLPEWVEYFSNHRFSEQFVTPSKYSPEQREALASKWLETQCMRDIKGYVTVFGLDRLMDRLRHIDKSDIPLKYKRLIS